MEWMDGKHLSELTEQNTDKEAANKISQTLWDFYMFQFHQLGIMHADPHPGNFLVNKEGELVVLDFGCTKVIPSNFYKPFNDLMQQENIENDVRFEDLLWELQIFSKEDTEEQKNIVRSIFKKMLTLLCAPFNVNEFDFSNSDFFTELAKMGDKMSKNKEIRTMSGNRGSEHFLYVNRTFFGLFSLLSQLNGGKIRTSKV